ncbi:MAG: hypothetical protein ACAI43_25595 [Phycisphaerae bacterium]|nr:hypothetical protein [Tepidisphaeraceae bacterium]
MRRRHFYILVDDWVWWAWAATTVLLAIGLAGHAWGFAGAAGVTVIQLVAIGARERRAGAFAVQLRVAYLVLLGTCALPGMGWLYWLPAAGTFALVVFGYCLLARVLSVLPWNRSERLSAELVWRTFTSRPDLARVGEAPGSPAGCAGGLCTIAAQVRPGRGAVDSEFDGAGRSGGGRVGEAAPAR